MGYNSGDAARFSGSEDVADTDGSLHSLADELQSVAARLRGVAFGGPSDEDRPNGQPQRRLRPRRSHLALARKTYALRRRRAVIFGNPDLFGEPAWDILLDLYIAQADGKSVSVSSACIGSAAPSTTGLRWLRVLADEGLVARENDAQDNRRVLVRLTSAGLTAMECFFDAVEADG